MSESPAMIRCRLVARWLDHERRKSRRTIGAVWERVAARVGRLAHERVTTTDVMRWLNPLGKRPSPRVRNAIADLSASSPSGQVRANQW